MEHCTTGVAFSGSNVRESVPEPTVPGQCHVHYVTPHHKVDREEAAYLHWGCLACFLSISPSGDDYLRDGEAA